MSTLETAWARYASRIKAAGMSITGNADPRLRAEGYRYIGRLTALAHQVCVEFADTASPTLFRGADDLMAFGATNIDNNYYRAPVTPAGTYLVSGDVTGVREMLFSVYAGEFVFGAGEVLAEVPLSELQLGPGGRLELHMGGPPRPSNWLPLPPGATDLGVREFVADWERDALAALVVERLDNGSPIGDLTPDQQVAALDRAAAYVEANVTTWKRFADQIRAMIPVNKVSPPTGSGGGALNSVYGGCIWNLGPGEALIVELDEPQAEYWSLQAYVLDWLLPLDAARRVTSLNQTQAHVDTDGKVRFVIAHTDPGVRNWIDTSGLPEGLAALRYTLNTTTPVPTTTMVGVGEVRAHLPASTPEFGPAERRSQLAGRRRGIARRFRG